MLLSIIQLAIEQSMSTLKKTRQRPMHANMRQRAMYRNLCLFIPIANAYTSSLSDFKSIEPPLNVN